MGRVWGSRTLGTTQLVEIPLISGLVVVSLADCWSGEVCLSIGIFFFAFFHQNCHLFSSLFRQASRPMTHTSPANGLDFKLKEGSLVLCEMMTGRSYLSSH